jgi:phenylalanyl-tRNA synthetase beta chain
VRLPYRWLCELVHVPGDPESIARTLALRGFEVADIEHGRDPVIDFEITANRPDCLSVVGLAREAAGAYGVPLHLPDRTMPAAGEPQPVGVTIEEPSLCPRYCAQVFSVRLGESPAWLRERLEVAAVRSINNVVDVTNYVMLELGQPTHAFDLERLAARELRIRRARAGETLRTLDGIDRTLNQEMLVIADGERPQAIAGVMGGASSEIGAETRLMVLESAYFTPASVRRTSKRLGLKTEASARFERGADIDAAPAAIARVAALLHQIGAAQPLGPTIDRYPSPKPPVVLTLRASRIERLLGERIPDADIPKILEPLGFDVRQTSDPRATGLAWEVRVPTFRVDVLREVDLIEEIARHDGYRGLAGTFPALTTPQAPPDPRTLRDRLIRQVLTASGLSEAVTFAFIERAAAASFAEAEAIVPIANPLSEKYNVLRPSLLPGLIDAAAYNRRRERRDIRLFETGTRFSAAGEVRAVAGVWSGTAVAPHWSGGSRPVDVFDVKGVVEALVGALNVEVVAEPASRPYFVEGRAAQVFFRLKAEATSGSEEVHATSDPPVASASDPPVASAFRRKILGELGQVAPAILDARGFPANEELHAFELNVDAVAALQPAGDLRAEPLPRFPSIIRDLSVLIESVLPAATVRGTIRAAAPDTLVQIVEFDRYRGKGVPEGRVSLSLRLTFRSPDRTLTDAEVDAAMAGIVAALESQHGAERR